MFTDITRTISALRILEAAIPVRDAAGKIEIYSAARSFLGALERNLNPDFMPHNYTRENLMRVDDAFAALCGLAQLGDGADVNWDAVAGRLGSSLGILSDPSRWPSKCTLVDAAGVAHQGTNDPA